MSWIIETTIAVVVTIMIALLMYHVGYKKGERLGWLDGFDYGCSFTSRFYDAWIDSIS